LAKGGEAEAKVSVSLEADAVASTRGRFSPVG
jgi:hypothetical protein